MINVTEIGERAFYGCSGLKSINIPNSVTNIGSKAFDGCSSLTSIVVNPDNPVYDSRDNCNAIIETSTNTLIAECKYNIHKKKKKAIIMFLLFLLILRILIEFLF